MAVNPITPGFAPDPSTIRNENWFYIVNSPFHWFPGLPIYASSDLQNWAHVDTKLHPHEDGSTIEATGGPFAPTFSHDSSSGRLYVIKANLTHLGDDCQNFNFLTNNFLSDEWTNPVFFDLNGSDPILFFDNDKVYTADEPGPTKRIDIFEIDLVTGEKMSEEKTIWSSTGAIYPDGPHIFKINGQYYLLISEDGIVKGHMNTVARSKSIWGPYEAIPGNPILTASGTDEYVQRAEHVDMVQDEDGDWYGVSLPIRKKGDRFWMGSEPFSISARFDGCPQLNRVVVEPTVKSFTAQPWTKDGGWVYRHRSDLSRHKIDESGTRIQLKSCQADICQWTDPVTYVAKRQRNLTGKVSVEINVPQSGRGGLINYKDEHHYARIFVDAAEKQIVFEIVNNIANINRVKSESFSDSEVVRFMIEYSEDELKFLFDTKGADLMILGVVETSELSVPDFVGSTLGVFAVSEEEVNVCFENFLIEE